MKIITSSNGYDIYVDDRDYDELIKFTWRVRVFKHTSYATRGITRGGKSISISMHRQIMGVVGIKNIYIDHIDFNGINNQRSNLRLCDKQQNNSHKNSAKSSKSVYLGVSLISKLKYKKWRATIFVNYKQIHLGYFTTEKDAAIAYNNAALKYHGEFANLNKF